VFNTGSMTLVLYSLDLSVRPDDMAFIMCRTMDPNDAWFLCLVQLRFDNDEDITVTPLIQGDAMPSRDEVLDGFRAHVEWQLSQKLFKTG
jgi:hypothetical protein